MEKYLDIKITEKLTVTIAPDEDHVFLMSTEQVAEGLGVKVSNIREHKRKNASEFEDGRHFLSSVSISDARSSNLQTNSTYWTKRGIIRLSMLVKSPQAKLMRDWAEDVVYKELVAQEERISHVRPTKRERKEIREVTDGYDVMTPTTFNKPSLQGLILEVALRADANSPESRLVKALKPLLFS